MQQRNGLEYFAAGDPAAAETLLRQAFQGLPNERGNLVNLGLTLMQQGKVDQAERCYRLALRSDELRGATQCCQKPWLSAALARRPKRGLAVAWPSL